MRGERGGGEKRGNFSSTIFSYSRCYRSLGFTSRLSGKWYNQLSLFTKAPKSFSHLRNLHKFEHSHHLLTSSEFNQDKTELHFLHFSDMRCLYHRLLHDLILLFVHYFSLNTLKFSSERCWESGNFFYYLFFIKTGL